MSVSNLFFREILKMFQRARIQFYLEGQVALYFIPFYPTPFIPSSHFAYLFYTQASVQRKSEAEAWYEKQIQSWAELLELVDGEIEGCSGEGASRIHLLIFTKEVPLEEGALGPQFWQTLN